VILALDTATVTGWACGKVGGTPKFGSRNFGGANVKRGLVFAQFRFWLHSGCAKLRPTLIVYESPYIPRTPVNPPAPGARPFVMNADTLRRLLWFTGEIEEVAAELSIECREATTSEIAKFFTGKARWPGGRDEKKERTKEMCRAYGWDVTNDNEADALALWAMAEAIVSPRASSARGDGMLFLPPTAIKSVGKTGKSAKIPEPEPSLF
jgi:hypothetical protein